MNITADNPFYKSIIVVAHPDDEILWFSSILHKVDAIIVCYLDYTPEPALGAGRRKVLSEYPLTNLSCLEITEAGSFNGADWESPKESEYGLEIITRKDVAERYKANFHTLHSRLATLLSPYQNVYTHNPWGEYGHEDHVQVYRAVKSLKQQRDFNLWFSNYGGNRSCELMLKYISGHNAQYVTRQTDIELATRITALYKKHNCWTWYGEYQWFKEESFMNDPDVPDNGFEHGHIFPVNFIKTNFHGIVKSGKKNKKSLLEKIMRKK